MDILVGCEESGVVRDAFIAKGHNAVSCDLVASRTPGPHIIGNVLNAIHCRHWDMGIFFYPCTHLAVSGARWFYEKQAEQFRAIQESKEILNAPIERISFENPIDILSTKIRQPDQIIQPWMFGHGETKATCLWLKNLPPLMSTDIVSGRSDRIHKMPPGPDRARLRSATYKGVADAMANQWG